MDQIITEIKYLKDAWKTHREKMEKYVKENEIRLRALEDWRLTFVTKFTVYSSIALFLGTIVAQAGLNALSNYMAVS